MLKAKRLLLILLMGLIPSRILTQPKGVKTGQNSLENRQNAFIWADSQNPTIQRPHVPTKP